MCFLINQPHSHAHSHTDRTRYSTQNVLHTVRKSTCANGLAINTTNYEQSAHWLRDTTPNTHTRSDICVLRFLCFFFCLSQAVVRFPINARVVRQSRAVVRVCVAVTVTIHTTLCESARLDFVGGQSCCSEQPLLLWLLLTEYYSSSSSWCERHATLRMCVNYSMK